MAKKACCYARVSTADQHSGLEAQIRSLKEYCTQNRITEFELFTDENFSGAKVSRPSLDRMMELVRKGEVSTVIVYSFSRFARSTTHLLTALEEMKNNSTEFISLTERIETSSPIGKAFFTIIAAIAQLERELIVERVKNGLRNAKAKGIHIGRKKSRPSELIRTLRRSGLSYSSIAHITKASEGAIGAELRLWKEELARERRTIEGEIAEYRKAIPIAPDTAQVNADGVPAQEAPLELEIIR